MTAATAPSCFVPQKYRSPFLLALIVAGLAGNYFKLSVFLDIDIIFGSIFALLALQFFGTGRGTLAAAAIASYSFFLWNHPYAIVIMTAEVAAVGLLMRRCRVGLVLADTLYWICIGIPLIWISYRVVMQVPLHSVYLLMAKQALNGIANAVIARIVFTKYLLRSRSALVSYHDVVYNLLAFFALFPPLILLTISSRADFARTDHRVRTLLMLESRQAAQRLDSWALNRKNVLFDLAGLSAGKTRLQMRPYLELAKKSAPDFQRILLLDRNSAVTASFPPSGQAGERKPGGLLPGSPFVTPLDAQQPPAEVFTCTNQYREPTIALISPLVVRGERAGAVMGILGMELVREHLAMSSDHNGMHYTLVDKSGNIIMTNRSDQKILTPLARGEGTLEHIGVWLDQWVPVAPANTPTSQRWQSSLYVTEKTIGGLADWKLILEQPVAPFQEILYEEYTGKLALLFLIFVVTLLFAEYVSRRIVATLERLGSLTHELPLRLAADGVEISWPASGIQETHDLICNFREMADSLSVQFLQVRLLNDSLEQRVQERTRELLESESFTLDVIDSLSSNIAVLDSDGVVVSVNEPWRAFSRDNSPPGAAANPVGTNYLSVCLPNSDHGGADAIAAGAGIRSVLRGDRDSFTMEYPCHSPQKQRWFAMNASRLKGSRSGAVVSHDNITGRRLVEDALRGNRALLNSIINGTSDAVYVKDLEGRYLLFNAAAERTVGKSAAEALGLDDFALFPAEQARAIRENDRQVTTTGLVGTFEVLVSDARGAELTFLTTKGPLLDAKGKAIGLFGISRDISERKHLEDHLKRALDQAEATNATMSRLLTTVAHEFRTPLGLLAGSTDILDRYWDRLSAPERFEHNELIRSAARQLTILINSVTSINFQQAPPSGEPPLLVDIKELCQVIADEVANVWCAGQNFEVAIAADCGSAFLAEIAFRRVLENLLTNAFRYTPAPGSVRLQASRVGDRLLMEISDTGIGIPDEDQSLIFQAFYRCLNVEGRRGLGLGLSLVRDSLSQLGGVIAVSSTVGEGTSIKVEIPVCL